MRESLHNYIYREIIPKYAAFDKAHREDHALMVIDRALSMGKQYDINEEMLLTAAACLDLGLSVNRESRKLSTAFRMVFTRADRNDRPGRGRPPGIGQNAPKKHLWAHRSGGRSAHCP